jgi:hypothetical protein
MSDIVHGKTILRIVSRESVGVNLRYISVLSVIVSLFIASSRNLRQFAQSLSYLFQKCYRPDLLSNQFQILEITGYYPKYLESSCFDQQRPHPIFDNLIILMLNNPSNSIYYSVAPSRGCSPLAEIHQIFKVHFCYTFYSHSNLSDNTQ